MYNLACLVVVFLYVTCIICQAAEQRFNEEGNIDYSVF